MLRWVLNLKGVPKKNFHAAVAVAHRVYSFGGHCAHNADQIGVHIFNTVSLRWIVLAHDTTTGRGQERPLQVPSMLYSHSAVAIEDIVYIWGGFTNAGRYGNGLYAFDVDTHAWFKPRVCGTVPGPRYNHSACALREVMYIYGGYSQLTGRTNSVHRLDTGAMVWSLVDAGGTPAPASERHFSTVIGTKMFVFGGYKSDYENYDNVRVFDTDTDCWLSPPSARIFPEVRGDNPAFAHGGQLYVFGGKHIDFNDLWRFNPDTFSWKRIVPKGKGPCWMSRMCCCTVGDRIVIFGVYTSDDLYILDLSPSLKTLCKLAVIRCSLERSGLPHTIRWELAAMTTNGNRKEY